MCIYYGNNPALHYKKQEHVIPATFGGRIKLPNGVVSDEANEFFSPIERFVSQKNTNSLF